MISPESQQWIDECLARGQAWRREEIAKVNHAQQAPTVDPNTFDWSQWGDLTHEWAADE